MGWEWVRVEEGMGEGEEGDGEGGRGRGKGGIGGVDISKYNMITKIEQFEMAFAQRTVRKKSLKKRIQNGNGTIARRHKAGAGYNHINIQNSTFCMCIF